MDPQQFLRELWCTGHRGAMGHEPENTLRSIRKGLELGARWIEIDVHVCEGEIVVIHDSKLERTTNGSGRIAECKLSYLRSLDAGEGECIPLLSEVLPLIHNRARLNIEIKGQLVAEPLAVFLEAEVRSGRFDYQDFIVQSFDHHQLAQFKKRAPNFPIALLILGIPRFLAQEAQEMGAYAVNLNQEFVTREMVDDAHNRGLKVLSYTVNLLDDIRRLDSLGVDGLISNYPDEVLKYRSYCTNDSARVLS